WIDRRFVSRYVKCGLCIRQLTSSKQSERLRALMLNAAVEDNVDTMGGRLSQRRPTGRQLLRRWPRVAWMAVLCFGPIIASAAVARRPPSAETASVMTLTPEKPTTGSSQLVPPAPSLLSQAVSPDVLALGVRRVIVDAGHGGDNRGTSDR